MNIEILTSNGTSLQTSPLGRLRSEKPGLFERPDFWKINEADIVELLDRARRGTRELLGYSAGGREIHAISYGALEPQQPVATISSANASDRPEAFFDPAKRTRPVLVVIGSIHGGETEGIALCANLISLMENGCDLRGERHQVLRDKLEQVRLVLVPNLNPDGREAAGVMHLCGGEMEDVFLVQQGILADGSLFRGRKIKEIQPIPPGYLQYLGGYYNADGVNLQHDDFFGAQLAPENEAIRDLFRREMPDAFLALHAHGGPATLLTPDAYLSPGYQRKQLEAGGFILSRLLASGIPVTPPGVVTAPPWTFYFQTWLHHATGALPLLFEFSHGLKSRPCTLEDTLDTGISLMDSWTEYCLSFGARPLSQELFAPITPAC